MKLVIDSAVCTGHGRCYTAAPALFQDDDEGHGLVKGDGQLTPEQIEVAKTAVFSCPEGAITLID